MSGTSNVYFKADLLLDAGNMAGSLVSKGFDLQEVDTYAIQAAYSGSPNGTLKLQISLDIVEAGPESDPAANVVNWNDYTYSALNIASAGGFIWKIDKGPERWVRLIYTRNSGSGTLNVNVTGKG